MLEKIFLLVVALLMVFGPLGYAFIVFFVNGEAKRFHANRYMACSRNEQPHNWTKWYMKIINDGGDCLERHCKVCGTLETKTHKLIQINIPKAQCEDRKMFCQDCGHTKTLPGLIAHDMFYNVGFQVSSCMRCGKLEPKL
jgi:hypothetical protein